MALLVGDVVRHAARVTPRALAATFGSAELTFAELDERANRIGHALAGLGVRHRDRVAWWGETSLEVMPIFAALAKLGAAFAPVNARLGATEAAEVVAYAKPRLLIVDAAHAELAAGWDVPTVTHAQLQAAADAASTDDVVTAALDERDTHVVFFTSGSTGRSKGVVLSHRASFLRSFPNLVGDASSSTVCMFPLFHMAGWSMSLSAWQARSPIHLATAPDADTLLATVARRRATRLYCIPAVWARILDHGISGHDLSSLREVDTGTSATPPELVAALRDTFPETVTRIYYGSTETGPGTLLPHADLFRKPGSVGIPQPLVSVRLTEEGEVCLTSAFLMDGYFEQPDATAAALRDGWYHTGDLGVLDDEGYLAIVGRARDVLRTGGETVAPSEVEAALASHPAVAEIAVVGIPDVQWGEIVCAVVVVREGFDGSLDLDALRAHCAGTLASFKQPRRLELVDALPRTAATGQIQRTLLVERITTTSGA